MLYLKGITNKDVQNSTGNSAQCHVAAWMGGEFWGEWIWICMAESLCCPPEIITLLIGYTPIQNETLGKKKKKKQNLVWFCLMDFTVCLVV